MIDLNFLLALVLLALALDLATVAARAAYGRTTPAHLSALRQEMAKPVARTLALLQQAAHLEASLFFVLIVTRFTLAGLSLAVLDRLIPHNQAWWQSVALLAVLAPVLFFLEWSVSRNAARQPERSAVSLYWFVRTVVLILAPLLGRVRASPDVGSGNAIEEDLKNLVDAGEEKGVLEHGERRMIYSIFDLSNTLAREIMVPRIDMLALEVLTPLPEAVDALVSSGHSRVPVYENTVDHMLGILYAKDLLRAWKEGGQDEPLRSLLRPVYFVPEAKKVDELLDEMQSQRIHIAIVVDEYGGIAGLVTLEDIVEEIVGDIRDEYDQGEEAAYQALKNGEYLFQGRENLGDFNDIMGSSLPTDDADTLGGFIYSKIGRVPEVGDTVRDDRLLLTVEQVSARRIRKVRACWITPGISEDEESDDSKNDRER